MTRDVGGSAHLVICNMFVLCNPFIPFRKDFRKDFRKEGIDLFELEDGGRRRFYLNDGQAFTYSS